MIKCEGFKTAKSKCPCGRRLWVVNWKAYCPKCGTPMRTTNAPQ